MYRVVKFFTDLQDGDHPYHVGEAFHVMGWMLRRNVSKSFPERRTGKASH